MSIASEALLKSGAADPAVATNTAAIAVNTAAIAALTNEVEGIRLGLWSKHEYDIGSRQLRAISW